MKKLFLFTAILSINFMNAQIKKGTTLLGADINYYQTKDNETTASNSSLHQKDDSKNFNLSVDAGYFVAQNFAVGIFAGYGVYSTNRNAVGSNYVQFGDTKQDQATFGVFARAYKLFNENKFGFFGELKGGYVIGSGDNNNVYEQNGQAAQINKTSSKTNGVMIGLRPGFVYFITPKIGLETSFGSLNFVSQKTDNSGGGEKISTDKQSSINFNLGVSTIYLGVHFYLGGK